MTPNRTSQAAEEMRKGGIDHLMGRPVRVAIGERFRRMQKALEMIVKNVEKDGYVRAGLLTDAQDALLFDPLTRDAQR